MHIADFPITFVTCILLFMIHTYFNGNMHELRNEREIGPIIEQCCHECFINSPREGCSFMVMLLACVNFIFRGVSASKSVNILRPIKVVPCQILVSQEERDGTKLRALNLAAAIASSFNTVLLQGLHFCVACFPHVQVTGRNGDCHHRALLFICSGSSSPVRWLAYFFLLFTFCCIQYQLCIKLFLNKVFRPSLRRPYIHIHMHCPGLAMDILGDPFFPWQRWDRAICVTYISIYDDIICTLIFRPDSAF